ncbi:MAG: OprD family outer membrane porin [Chitinophagaceae bacterium]|jgi:hypothetical protein|nr:OprD family outer membrane porin [Chitinophagaceae bacterium]
MERIKQMGLATLLILVILPLSSALAQHGEDLPSNARATPDTNTLRHALRKGKFDAHFRLYYMATQNEQELSDYYALAFGGGVKYETGAYKGFRLGVGGFFTWNLASSDLAALDPVTGAKNRYEIGQFDVEDPENKNDLDRLEDFYISYAHKNWKLTFGKQVMQSPFVNPQDGRMRPTGEQGLWGYWQPSRKWKMEGGWLTKISPRGTVRWFDIEESIGVYPVGLNIYGEKSQYKGNLESAGIGILGLHYQVTDHIRLQGWDHFVEGIFNTAFMQADAEWPAGRNFSWLGGFQYTYQHAVGDGGNSDPHKAYYHPDEQSQVFSARAGVRNKHTQILLNATRITADGRFLMPREWGREPFYTFLPRERSEGNGDVKAISMNFIRQFPQQRIRAELGYGYYDLADIRNVRLNKYQFPSYHQFLADVRYRFGGFLEGMNVQALYTFKRNAGETYEDPRYVINKVNMHHFNLVVNYLF